MSGGEGANARDHGRMAVPRGELPAPGRNGGLLRLLHLWNVFRWARRDVAIERVWGRRRAEDARGSRGQVGYEGGDDGEVVADVDNPA